MSTTTLHRRLRQQMPWLTPQIAGDDDSVLSTLLQRVPPLATDDAIPTLTRPPLTATPEPLPIQPTPEFTNIPALQLPELRRTPSVVHSEGRPTPIVFGTDDPEQRVLAQRRALEAYQPQKESVKKLLLRAGLNTILGGLPAAAQTLLGQGGVMDRRGTDRAWQQGQLAQTDSTLGRMRTDRRAGFQDRLLGAQVSRAERPEAPALIQIPDAADLSRDVLVPKTPGLKIPTRPKLAPEKPPLMKEVTFQDGSTGWSKSEDNGKTWKEVPELRGAPKPSNDPPPAQIDAAIASIEREQQTLGPSPPTEIADTNQWGDVIGKKTNPAYLDWAKRYRELDDQKRQLQLKRKTPPTLTQGGVSAPPTFITAFKKKHGRAPTQAEIDAYAQAANAR